MTDAEKDQLIFLMTKNLPMLRTALGLTQESLGNHIGLSRYTIMCIDTGKRKMSWNVFLLLILVFTKNGKTVCLLEPLGIYTDQLDEYFRIHENEEATRRCN